jgi:hypothetical protein
VYVSTAPAANVCSMVLDSKMIGRQFDAQVMSEPDDGL